MNDAHLSGTTAHINVGKAALVGVCFLYQVVVEELCLLLTLDDYGYDEVFARQVQGMGQSGDAFIGISTSGNSQNIVQAIGEARKKGMKVICFLGKDGGKIKE